VRVARVQLSLNLVRLFWCHGPASDLKIGPRRIAVRPVCCAQD